MRELKEHLSKEGVEFIQQSCSPEEIERIKAITPQGWVKIMYPVFCTPVITNDEVAGIFVTEEVRKEILE